MAPVHSMVGATSRVVALLATLLVLLVVALVGPGQTFPASGQEPATPVCPTGSTFNAATGQCETPPTATCPPGTTLVGTTCTVTRQCPTINGSAGAITTNPVGGSAATCSYLDNPPSPLTCPPGSTIASFNPGVIGSVASGGFSGSITCTAPPASACPAGFTASGATCVAPPTLTCPPELTLSGTICLPGAPTTTALLGGTAGDVDASGGDGGSARGGDGGRGGSGTLPICNQNTNDSSWEELVQEVDDEGYVVDEYVVVHEAEPSLDCEAGARGGNAGDAGLSEAGDGGLAFSAG